MTSFSLRHTVREVLASCTMADPRRLADEAFRRIDPDDYGTALSECLPDVVREEIRASRNLTAPAVMSERASRQPAAGRSAKVSGIRSWWQQRLRERINVGPAPSDWRMLGDCGVEDLLFAAAQRRQIAARNEAKADEYTELADAVREAGVQRVRDLPPPALRAHLTSEAA